jgi:parallel beta-helix repeat protein
MTMPSWLRPLFPRFATRRIRKISQKRRLKIEALEHRWVPSTFTVLNTLDDGSAGSLRWAVGQANSTPGADTITFDSTVFKTPRKITLTGGQLELSDMATTTISGPAAGVMISGNNASRVFAIDGGASAALSGLTITGGNVTDNGGGLLNNGTATLTNCTVTGSSGASGGGLTNNGTVTLTSCTFSGNTANYGGGGLYNSGVATATLTNCTVSGNSASQGAGGIANYGTATLTNSIVAGNNDSADDLIASVSGNNNLIGGNPLLAPLGNYGGPTPTMPPLPGSPAIDAGASGAGIPTTDQRGLARVGAIDIGASESQGFVLAPAPGSTPQTSNIGSPFPSITAVVTAKNPIEPVNGGVVSFAAKPAANGATALIANSSVVIANGRATLVAAPNNILGSYTVVATAAGLSTSFVLTNAGKTLTSLVVNSTSDSIAPGAGLLSLREAIDFANSAPSGNQSITFDPTAFATPQTITLTGSQLELSRTTGSVTITGPAAGVTIAAGGLSRVFQLDVGVTASLARLTLSGGCADNGGGLLNNGITTLSNCTVSGNAATFGGGGGLLNNGTVTLTNCTVSGNSSAGGFSPDGTYHTGRGGGLDNYGTATLTNCTVSGNSTQDAGGGVSTEGSGTTALANCTLSGNSASTAGGGLANAGTTTLSDCTISGNSTNRFGGAMAIHGTVTLTNCTVSNNSAGQAGGGLYDFSDGTATLSNTIVAGNAPNDVYNGGGSISGSNNLIGTEDSSEFVNRVAGNVVGVNNPLLAPLGNYGGPTQTMPLLPGSLAIDAGATGAGIPTTDQRGMARFGGVDIGAFESQGFTLKAVTGSTPQTANIGTAFANPLAVNVVPKNAVEPVDGGVVPFAINPAANGAAAIDVSASTVIANGQASSVAEPNNVLGKYTVVVSVPGSSASFALTNAGKAFASLVVNSTSDSLTPGAGLLSLREAVAFANAAPSGNQTITFDPTVFATPQTIILTGTQLELSRKSGSVTITGPAAGVTIAGSGQSRVFEVDAGVTASFSLLTLTGGSADYGGGLYNYGTATLSNCTVSGNTASGGGGGLANYGMATLTLTNCTVSGNYAAYGGGILNYGTATLTGCTVSGNSANNTGGGLDNESGTATLSNCTVSGNTADLGGGVFLYDGQVILNNCAVTGNSASASNYSRGGGLFTGGGTATLTDCTVSGNSANAGGGGVFNESTVTLNYCAVSGNSVNPDLYANPFDIRGGGVYNRGTATLTNCTVSGNSAANGGGLDNYSKYGTATLSNCTISGNSADSGGGLDNFFDATVTLTNCTVSGNSATGFGTGLDNFGTATLINTIVAGNDTATNPFDLAGFCSGNNNLIGSSIPGGFVNGVDGNIVDVVNPLLAPLGNYGGPTQTMPLLPGSPAIDAGASGAGIPATDQRGLTAFGGVDIGAFESQGFTLKLVAGSTPQSANIGTSFAKPLAVSVVANNSVEPVNGGVVIFAANPAANGATAIITNPWVVIANGRASLVAAPNNVLGSYTVVASIPGSSASFALSNAGKAFASLMVNTTSDLLTPGAGLLSLRESVAFANTSPSASSTITFDPIVFATPRKITLTGTQLELSRAGETVTITGPAAGVTVNGGKLSRVFQVDAGVTASVSKLTIAAGSASDGGGVANFGTATLTNCTISGSSASSGGGALANFGTATLNSCLVTGNSAYFGGALYNQPGSTAKLINCVVTGNTAAGPGGGVYNSSGGTVTLSSCTFSHNTSSNSYGGALMNRGTATLSNCTVSNNSAATVGGGLENFGTAILSNCNVRANTASNGTGGMQNNGTVTLTNCNVTGNIGGDGGLGNYSTATLNNCNVGGNTGGGIGNHYQATLTLNSCSVSSNTGHGLVNNGTANLTGCTVNRNTGTGLVNSATVTLNNCTVSGNTGGGVSNSGTVTLTNCTVSRNSATNGGGVFNNGTATLSNCTISGNTAVAGGGVYNAGALTVGTSKIAYNLATSKGGGVCTVAGNVAFTASTIINNKVISTGTAQGGGISSENSHLSLTNCTDGYNQANGTTGLDGGIYALNSTVTVQNSTVTANKVTGTTLGQGGGIYGFNTVLAVLTSTVKGNKDTNGFADLFTGP